MNLPNKKWLEWAGVAIVGFLAIALGMYGESVASFVGGSIFDVVVYVGYLVYKKNR